MKEEFQFLLDLQEVDKTIREIHNREEAIPKEFHALDEDLRIHERTLKEEQERLKETEKRRRGLEMDLATLMETLKKHQTQLHTVKTNKEYTALLHEIEEEKKKISSVEEDILILIDEVEIAVAKIKEKEGTLKEIKRRKEEKEKELEREKDMLGVELQKKETARKEILSRMDGPLLTQYERIRRGRQGLAIVAIRGSVCEACYTALPPQMAVEVRKGEQLQICENCGRILVWKGD